MRFDQVLNHVREACDPRSQSQLGTRDMAKVHRRALQELLQDWERLDREVRHQHEVLKSLEQSDV